jgi:hypothetical protein
MTSAGTELRAVTGFFPVDQFGERVGVAWSVSNSRFGNGNELLPVSLRPKLDRGVFWADGATDGSATPMHIFPYEIKCADPTSKVYMKTL